MGAEREALKADLLSLLSKFNDGTTDAPNVLAIQELVDNLAPLSPIPNPNQHLPEVAGRCWSNLYASFGTGHSKGKSHHDGSTLALQTFKAFPDIPIHVTDIIQEIGEGSNLYNNVAFSSRPSTTDLRA